MTTKTKVMTTAEVAERLVNLCREGKNNEAIQDLYGEGMVSIEPEGSRPPIRKEGLKEVLASKQVWNDMVEQYHGQKVSDPIVAGDHFAVTMWMDVSVKGMGRMEMDEVAVYKVKDGKIVKEQFFYTPPPMN